MAARSRLGFGGFGVQRGGPYTHIFNTPVGKYALMLVDGRIVENPTNVPLLLRNKVYTPATVTNPTHTIEVVVGELTLYIHAKTTND